MEQETTFKYTIQKVAATEPQEHLHKLVNKPISDGIVPVNLLLDKSNQESVELNCEWSIGLNLST